MHHEPEDPMECPDCGSSDLEAHPYPDMDESMEGPATSTVVPADCGECGAQFELVYEFNSVAY